MGETKSRLYKLFYIVIVLVIVVSIVMWIFNLTFSLPTTFENVVEDNAEKSVSEIEKIEIRKYGKVVDDFSEYIPPEDDREFIVDDDSQFNQFISDDYRLYRISNLDRIRDKDNEYELTLERANGHNDYYIVGDGYVIDFSAGESYKVLGDGNELYNKVTTLFNK